MQKTICPVCKSTNIKKTRYCPDDHGMRWETLYRCEKCGRCTDESAWEKLTDSEQLKIKDEQLKELEKQHIALLACLEGKIPDIPFLQQMEILLNHIKRIGQCDGNGDCTLYLVKPPKTSYAIPDFPILKRAEKVTKFTIYFREIIE